MASTIQAALTDAPIDIAACVTAVSAPDCGGIGLFVGTVRETSSVEGNEERRVVRLGYEAHPTLAGERMHLIAETAAERWGLRTVLALHRTGECELSEPTVVVACGAPHRKDALEACRWMIDEIKTTVPIWKREIYSDGSSWVGEGS